MIKLIIAFWQLNIKSCIEYKTSFIIQVIWMCISDIFTIVMWYFFFLKFGKIWTMWMNEYIILYCCILFSYCFVHIFFWWYRKISTLITDWSLDSFLLLPKNILLVITLSWIVLSVFWDLLFWVVILFFVKWITLLFIIKLIFFSLLWWIVLLWFLIFFHSLGFYIVSSREMTKLPFDLMLWPSHYPPDSFEWTFLKKIYLSFIPVFYAFFYSYQLMIKFDLKIFLILVLAAIFYLWLSVFIFHRWLRKYESGNVVTFVS